MSDAIWLTSLVPFDEVVGVGKAHLNELATQTGEDLERLGGVALTLGNIGVVRTLGSYQGGPPLVVVIDKAIYDEVAEYQRRQSE